MIAFRLSFFAFVLFLSAQLEGEIRVAGSDLLGSVLMEKLEAWSESNPDLRLTINFEGSILASQAMESGDADILILAVPDFLSLPDRWQQIPFAYEIARILVTRNNPLNSISLQQLRRIYGQTLEPLTHWDELGLEGEWIGKNIQLHALRKETRLNWQIFQALALGDAQPLPDVNFVDELDSVFVNLLEDPQAIAVTASSMDLPGSVKELSVSLDENQPAYPPTHDNIYFGDYPLRLSYRIVYSGETNAELDLLLEYLLSEEIALYLEEMGFVPLPDSERASLSP